MGLFESVQLELFELMGYKKRQERKPSVYKPNMPNKQHEQRLPPELSFENFSCPVELIRKKI